MAADKEIVFQAKGCRHVSLKTQNYSSLKAKHIKSNICVKRMAHGPGKAHQRVQSGPRESFGNCGNFKGLNFETVFYKF